VILLCQLACDAVLEGQADQFVPGRDQEHAWESDDELVAGPDDRARLQVAVVDLVVVDRNAPEGRDEPIKG